MELKPGCTMHGFAISKREDLPEIEGEAYVGVHSESGAKLLYLKNDDANKSFAIGFRTPPEDDTGVFHILEHSVLCGSRRFPVKEPFVDLLKTSMQTFLNAMTFADKTLYPVASTNEQDLINLMDVYLDAVFHPCIYDKPAIFQQEGWHLELKRADGTPASADDAELAPDQTKLTYNGVVFNEMKGALSDSSSVLYDELQKALFPDTCYAFESGGTPEAIPTLTYERFLEEHARHYRTDNSYIILYGNMDIDRVLGFIDEHYLRPVAAEQRQADAERAEAGLEPLRPRAIGVQAPLRAGYVRKEMDTAPENAVAACGYVVGDASQRMRAMAADILLDALLGSNEAPLKRALLDAGVAHDVHAFVSDALAQPFAVVQASMPAEGEGEKLAETVAREVRALLDRGLDHALLEAALSHEEFVMREHDLGYADGVIYSMTTLSSWLYDDDAATDYLRYEDAFAQLRTSLEAGYFEQLCAELFLENAHMASAEVVPVPNAGEGELDRRLAALADSLGADERARIVADEALLRELQEAPDAPEAKASLPRLGVEDLGDAADEPCYRLGDMNGIACLRHDVATRGIAYAYRYFDAACLSFEELPYASVLAMVLGKLGTAKRTAAEIDVLAQDKLGNMTFFIDVFERKDDPDAPLCRFVAGSSALSANVEWLAQLPREVLLETDFSDTGKILDVLKQRKIGMEQAFAAEGHLCATARCNSYHSKTGVLREQIGNVDFYRFLCDLVDRYDERAGELAQRLQDIAARLFCDDGCLFSFAGGEDDFERFCKANPECGRDGNAQARLVAPAPTMRNEAFIVPSDVCYAAVSWDAGLLGETRTGSWVVAAKALSLDYLWNEVRVKGGAYGVGFRTLRTGAVRFYSYRDPHLDETLARFADAAEWLAGFDPAPEQFEGFIVSCVASVDAPVKPRGLVRRQAGDYLTGHASEERLQLRREMIAATPAQARAFATTVKGCVDAGAVCAFGNREILEASDAGLQMVELFG